VKTTRFFWEISQAHKQLHVNKSTKLIAWSDYWKHVTVDGS